MIEQVITQGAIVPAAISSTYLLYATYKEQQENISITLYTLLWLLAYVWIVGMPSVPPIQAVDWLLLLVVFSASGQAVVSKYKQLITLLVFSAITILMILPLLNQGGAVAFTTLIDCSILSASIITAYIVAILCKVKNKSVDVLGYSALLMFSSVVVVIKGSLLIGLLLMAQCVMVSLLWIYAYRQGVAINQTQLEVFSYLTLSLIFISRVYVDVDIWLYVFSLSVFGVIYLGKGVASRVATFALIPIVFVVIYTDLMAGSSGPY